MNNFSDLALEPQLILNLTRLGFREPTPIQEQAIPVILEGRDVLGIAQTGTGKTGAFGLPAITKVLRNSGNTVQVLILSPTRELCTQIVSAIDSLAADTTVKSVAIYGGVGQAAQVKAIKDGAQIVVATPGRLLDLIQQKVIRLATIETLVLDEADRMLDMGFIDDLKEIISHLPSGRQTLLFSATMPDEIERLAGRILRKPVVIEVAAKATVASNIDQRVIVCRRDHKFQLLKKLIKEEAKGLVLVFTRTKNTADSVVEYLAQNRMASRAIHADKNQDHREKAMSQFGEGSIRVLIATDLVSRGIDVENVGHVINFDLPLDPETYVHRIGRTARAGKSGKAISFCEENEKERLSAIEELIQSKLKTENFQGRNEALNLDKAVAKKIQKPTPGKSQEKTAWLDHSKRQKLTADGKKINVNPAFKNKKKKKR